MLAIYHDALDIFGIKQGFVEEQIDELYHSLISHYQAKQSSPSDKKYEIKIAYDLLKEPFPHYIVNQYSGLIQKEQMIEEINKSIYDYRKKEKAVDKYFIAKLVEILVSYYNLHSYVKDIEFRPLSKCSVAGYYEKTLKVYEENLKRAFSYFSSDNNEAMSQYPYYRTVASIGHELTHAEQNRVRELNKNDIWTIRFVPELSISNLKIINTTNECHI